MSTPTRYQPTGLVLVRATTDPGNLDPPTHLKISDTATAQVEQEGRAWLTRVWSRGEVREALQMASPVLAARIDQLLTTDPAAARDLRRAIVSAATYLLRWQRRATPFGLFAGVTTALIGPASATIGTRHRAMVRADAEWITMLIDQIERHPKLRPHLMVVADNTGVVRDGRFIVARQADLGAHTPGSPRELSVGHTRPLQAVLALAASPIRFDALAEKLAGHFPATAPGTIHTLLHSLVDQRVLITSLRPPMTAADPVTHLIGALRAAGGHHLPDIAAVLERLEKISEQLTRHNAGADPQQAAALRASAAAQMSALTPGAGPVLATDVRLDAHIVVPERVLAEAAHAADVLLRLSTQPFGSAAWLDYHARFRTRYGPGTLVPVRELVADSGLGYPGGYLGAPRARPAWRMLTQRDAALLALIQKATLDGAEEITLTEADVEALTVGEHTDLVPPQRIELGVALHATNVAAIDRGAFELWVTAAPRAHTSMAGRFAPLLEADDRARLAASYRVNGAHAGRDAVVAVQLAFPPRRPHNANVVRVPRFLPDVVALGEHPDGDVIGVDDLAVTADAEQMYLVQRSTGRRVLPRIPHALETSVHSPPLARFLAEVADARSAVFGPFNLGAARTLPYVPRIRYRRTVLAAARWILAPADLSDAPPGESWDAALCSWWQRWRVPARIVLCGGELRLPLDLDQAMDRALLRTRLERAERIEVAEDGAPGGQGWVGRPAELLIPMTAIAPPPRRLPTMAAPGAVLRPGDCALVHAHLVGNPARFDELLAAHLPAFVGELGGLTERWWVRRHRDMIRLDADQYLAVTLRLACPEQYGPVAARLAAFAAALERRGLPAQLTLASYPQHPARYGHGPALSAAEQVFAADTTAAIAQITMAAAAGLPAQALAAASMTQLAAAFAADSASGYRALVGCLKQQTGPLEQTLRDHALRLADPADDFHAVRALPGGQAVATAWRARDAALAAYHHILTSQRDPATVLRTLLHEHHVRAVGVDPEFEKVTGRLARAAALRRLALAGAL
ncbi:lantibiotic dehydratase (plasmid) [Streptosporangium sp. CA-135522]|uniref:lantibiotic dehydratase n=1 Tax=Streptosporangium sp. CA-135522 TaxID=3240072 RepID=UPI003D8AD046